MCQASKRKMSRYLPKTDREKIYALYTNRRSTQAELAKQFNISLRTVRRIIHTRGASAVDQRKEENKKLLLMHCSKQPRTVSELSKKMHLSGGTIRKLIKQLPLYRFKKIDPPMPFFYAANQKIIPMQSLTSR